MIKRLFAAEHLINFHIISRIVLVVGVCFEDGRKVNGAHTKAFEVVKLFGNAPECAAKEHIVGKRCATVRGILRNAAIPVLVQYRILAQRNVTALGKAVNEDLIQDAAFEPIGRGVVFIVYGQTKRLVAFVCVCYTKRIGVRIVRKAKRSLCRIKKDRGEIQPRKTQKGKRERIGVDSRFASLPYERKGETVGCIQLVTVKQFQIGRCGAERAPHRQSKGQSIVGGKGGEQLCVREFFAFYRQGNIPRIE